MRVRELLCACVLAGCVANPDPRSSTITEKQREGLGSYIEITTRPGARVAGELISAEPNVLRVLRLAPDQGLVSVPITDVRGARLFEYQASGKLTAWGVFGTLSTLSHGFLLVISAPVWLLTTGIVARSESTHVILDYPDTPLADFRAWARFPQGMPPGLSPEALLHPEPVFTPGGAPGATTQPR